MSFSLVINIATPQSYRSGFHGLNLIYIKPKFTSHKFIQFKVCEIDAYKEHLTNAFLTSSQGAAAMPGGDSEVKDIPMAECMAYGTVGTHQTRGDYSVSPSFPGGVGEVQLRINEDEGGYEPIPN